MDSPSTPRAVDGNTLIHTAFGFGLGAGLVAAGLGPGIMVAVVAAAALFWEVFENTCTEVVAEFIGPPAYSGDSWQNSLADIVSAVAAAGITVAIGTVAAAVTAGVLAVLWAVWAYRTDHLPLWLKTPEAAIPARLPLDGDFV